MAADIEHTHECLERVEAKMERLTEICAGLSVQVAVLQERTKAVGRPAAIAGGLSGSALAGAVYLLERLFGQ